jgi:hypothetical protein
MVCMCERSVCQPHRDQRSEINAPSSMRDDRRRVARRLHSGSPRRPRYCTDFAGLDRGCRLANSPNSARRSPSPHFWMRRNGTVRTLLRAYWGNPTYLPRGGYRRCRRHARRRRSHMARLAKVEEGRVGADSPAQRRKGSEYRSSPRLGARRRRSRSRYCIAPSHHAHYRMRSRSVDRRRDPSVHRSNCGASKAPFHPHRQKMRSGSWRARLLRSRRAWQSLPFHALALPQRQLPLARASACDVPRKHGSGSRCSARNNS